MKSYFNFLSRNKLYTAIETFGLSVALGFVIILGSYASMSYSVGKGNSQTDDVYCAGMGDDIGMTWGTPKEFYPSVPEIKEWTRFSTLGNFSKVTVGDDNYNAKVNAADPNFFKMFGYSIRGYQGDRVLTNESQAIVSESFATNVFGNENPVGKMIKCDTVPLKIIGVVKDFGETDLFKPTDIIVSMKHKENSMSEMNNFGEVLSFVRLDKGADPEKVAATLSDKYAAYWPNYTPKNDGNYLWGSTLQKIGDLYFSDNSNWQLKHGDKGLVDILLAVAITLLVCAVFNYINLTVAQGGKRAKEMAIRRLLGESVWGVVMRYFKEATLFTTACFILGLVLAAFLLPVFNDIIQTKISFDFSPKTLLYTVVALLAISFLCGIVPAVVVSRFNPIDVVKGSLQMRSKMWFSKVFITAQGVVSTVLIAVGITMTLQMHHLYTLPYGYEREDIAIAYTMSIGLTLDRQQILAEKLKALPEVEEATPGGGTPIDCGSKTIKNPLTGEELWVSFCSLDSTAMRILGIKVLERYSEPTEGKVWITESGKRSLGLSAKKTTFGIMDSEMYFECCGVIADYRTGDALSTLSEKCYNGITVAPHDNPHYTIIIKTKGDHDEAMEAIKKTCGEVSEELTGTKQDIRCDYIEDLQAEALKSNRNTMTLVLSFMLISVMISALGMFAMSVYYSEQQRRQIALRKVMGATVMDAAWTLSRRFLVMSVVAIVLATPLSIKVMRHYLQDFYNQIDFPWWVLAATALFTIIIAFASVISRTLKVAKQNPIESIKTE